MLFRKKPNRRILMRDVVNAAKVGLLSCALAVCLALPAWAQDPAAQEEGEPQSQTQPESGSPDTSQQPGSTQSQQDWEAQQTDPEGDRGATISEGQQTEAQRGQEGQTHGRTLTAGQKQEIEGFVIQRDSESVTILAEDNQRVVVGLTDQTEVKERKRNPFRGARRYEMTHLLPGLRVKVEGQADASGRLVAEEIRFRDDDLQTAVAIETRVNPVERDLLQTQQNAERLSGQVSELGSVSNAARGGAVAAQETADRAVGAAEQAQSAADRAATGVRAANERIVSLDNFDIKESAVVNFRVDSAQLSDEAKAALDDIAGQIASERGFMVEVVGFASSDGNPEYNRRLSQRRADSVVRYLAEQHNVPLRRIVTPFGFGELQPIADNSTREGRQQNRRVEVRVLINRGIHDVSAGMQDAQGTNGRQEDSSIVGGQTRGEFKDGNESDSGTTADQTEE
jgi:outer membrane protein OmpA-like peptidoglycan-associated protein